MTGCKFTVTKTRGGCRLKIERTTKGFFGNDVMSDERNFQDRTPAEVNQLKRMVAQAGDDLNKLDDLLAEAGWH
jgi:hypothetical protein